MIEADYDPTTEAERQITEAAQTGKITLLSGEVVELGTRRADSLLRLAEAQLKRAPKRKKRMTIVEDFAAQNTSH